MSVIENKARRTEPGKEAEQAVPNELITLQQIQALHDEYGGRSHDFAAQYQQSPGAITTISTVECAKASIDSAIAIACEDIENNCAIITTDEREAERYVVACIERGVMNMVVPRLNQIGLEFRASGKTYGLSDGSKRFDFWAFVYGPDDSDSNVSLFDRSLFSAYIPRSVFQWSGP